MKFSLTSLMKFRLTPIIMLAIVILHICFFMIFFRAPKQNKGGDSATENGPSEPQEAMEFSDEYGPHLPNEVETIPAFSENFFREDIRKLPDKLNKQIAQIRGCVVVDVDRRRILFDKEAKVQRPIASITKMMTAYLAVKKMHASNGALTLETPIKVTRAASRIDGRRVYLDPKETFTLDEMLKAALVHSANDAAYLIAEFLGGGNEKAFVDEMNKEAAELGCKSLIYYNSHGLPTADRKENMGAPIELAYLSMQLMKCPEIMRWTNVKREFLRENNEAYIKKYGRPTELSTSNKLLGTCKGVNGMKTGTTNKAGSCIVATCERDGKRVVVVALGGNRERDKIVAGLIDWAYTQL